ncbi:hypothetical protein L1887_53545 [Cichorium endivia]|nr:hypothetical protein L1887_53545 [Cichorium endivia]
MRGSARIVLAMCSRSVSGVARLSMLREGTSTTLSIAAGTSSPAPAAAVMRASASLTAGHLPCKEEARCAKLLSGLESAVRNAGLPTAEKNSRRHRSRAKWRHTRRLRRWDAATLLCGRKKRPSELEPGCSPLAGHEGGLAATDAVLSWAELRRAADKMKHPRVMSAKASHHSHGQGGREEQQRLGLDPELAFPKSEI